MRPLTLGRLARLSGLARSSLLHYEALGLLEPQGRSPGGYRLYGEPQLARLKAIRAYREAGLSLAAIQALLAADGPALDAAALLQRRLLGLSEEIQALRQQQHLLAQLLANPALRGPGPLSKASWSRLLREAGFSEADMQAWHRGFEQSDPQGHKAFLASLGIEENEIALIRSWAI
ncbi:MerR family transcriptional regulator [Gallaecimonas kandeliae]|uniref:MerR family transcriptional regulator n=1 Tax=Gallaecimonas kandeliae TaxID=3029055 RepID=UPI0026471156|nr:MerR family transcriptional regulator [Gallaecimonas kandeliae]WKE65175.1 MerR family transcriptional regulator [Gallaecimonas kandeliae]